MRLAPFSGLTLMLLASGCANAPKAEKAATLSSPAPVTADANQATATMSPPQAAGGGQPAAAAADLLPGIGLAEFCKFAAKDGGQGCFTCTPRELEITHCTAVPANFDPGAACKNSGDQMRCDLGGATAFSFDFTKKTALENTYDSVPLILLGAKVLLAGKLDSQPAMRDFAYGTLDAIDKDKLAIFSGADIGPMLDTIEALAQKADPKLTKAQLAGYKAAVTAAVDTVRSQQGQGQVAPGEIINLALTVLKTLPPDVASQFGEQLTPAGIAAAIRTVNATDPVQQLLAGSGGGTVNAAVLSAVIGNIDPTPATPSPQGAAVSTAVAPQSPAVAP